MIKMFCDRCGGEIIEAPTSETDEVEISYRRPETGDDTHKIATICNKCYVEVFVEGKAWKK